ncbi:hypothetical protein GCM10023168_30970 [Fodinibacter luteus]|uniref:Tetratricopeptide repeat protein n=1 Tax=Fodinibacter luteus TaxID=552064 RepID=A0ABP8KP95_9MICO
MPYVTTRHTRVVGGDGTASEAVRDARAALETGSAWRARDLLAAHVEAERDPDALAELARVLHDMGDLPRAGAMWFAAGATGPEADADVAAWREQSHDDFAVMWHSLPASVRAEPRARRVEALRERALALDPSVARDEPAGAAVPAGAAAQGGTGDEAGTADGPDTAARAGTADPEEGADDADGGFDAAWLVAWVLAVAFVVFAVIGFVTALGWIVPG